ncbi:MAG: type V CRISPR-associated protein Cas12a/Cpf1 [Treponemataceae bacterium]|nr:type V CRISPR-associated protein Cas12a/Cpf1 [Treponemataceae bacterium]
MARIIDEFCGQENGYSRSITLRNKLIPIGKTADNLKQFLEKDQERADAYPEIKKLIDEIHRGFIEDTLTNFLFVWQPLFDDFELYQNEKDKSKKATKKKDLEKFQSGARKKIVEAFKKHTDYDKLFKDGLFKELLPALIQNSSDSEISNKEEALKVFDRFSTYFVGFHENRKNMYSEEEKSTAISYRIVNENFPKFYANVKLYNYLKENFPEIISDTEESLNNHLNRKKLDDIFNVEAFNDVLAQSGIDFYNTVIGGISTETEKVQGLNEKINLARQQVISQISFLKNQNASENTEKIKALEKKANELKKKMVVLFKQILSDRGTSSFIPVGFNNNDEVYSSVKSFNDEFVNLSVSETKELFKQVAEFNCSEIYVSAKSLTNFSQNIFGSWSILIEGLFLLEKDKAKKALSENQEEKINKEIAKKDYSLNDLQVAYERYCNEHNFPVEKNCKDYFDIVDYRTEDETTDKKKVSILSAITESYSKIDFENIHDLQQEKEAATPIKTYLDEVQNLYHHLKLVDYRGEEQKDSSFYSKLDEIITQLSEIIPLYNKVRNFVTKKPGEMKKIKLNFDCPTLANGWDENKESSNDAIILRKDGKYYLGIFNPNNKPKFSKNENNSESFYEKMVYKLLPGPNKMLPKVFFSTKGQETFLPPKDLLLGYNAGKHKKGDSFDKEFMYKLIDWFKDAINRHEDWKKFNFVFSPTKSYEDMSGFYREVELQGYKVSFQKITDTEIDSFVNDGKLFLFQIYNKDFASKTSGKKNLHTLYWENLFSEENLKDVCLKLNGEAELFWRKPSLNKEKVTVHKKGSILVNRTTSDGKSIPEDIYQEIYQFKNKMKDKISDNISIQNDDGKVITITVTLENKQKEKFTENYKVVYKTATHYITKDNRFTEDTYLFHCPITMNFKAPDKSNKEFNNHVLEVLSGNPDVKIIGLDRGERHLIYLSLINQKGEIELQKTLNLVDQVRNDKTVKVNYQEKLVHKEGDRDRARKNWQTIGNIKELKEGYLSNVVHEIAKMMVEHNAIVVMEDLNFGFKRGRFSVERQIYQKFENMLIEKLNYLVFKDKKVTEPGGVLNAYQLTNKSANVSDVYRQCGWLFYIPAAYTSKIDPKTGFANLFITKGLTNVEKKKEFFEKFDSIRYDSKEDCFVFGFNYEKICDNADFKKKWEVYTKGERLVYNKTERKNININPTEQLKNIFDEFNVNWNNEDNFIDSVQTIQAEKSNAKFFDTLLRMFNATLQMRNSIPNTEIDYLISPVKSEDGTFFDSREELKKGENAKLPIDADANGAYHIALKGLYLLENDFKRNDKGVIQNISNADWFKFVQEKEYKD